MSNAELAVLLFLILTVGHYAVLWSMYLEKQLVRLVPTQDLVLVALDLVDLVLVLSSLCFQDEMLSKKKKEKKKRASCRPADDLRCAGPDRTDRCPPRVLNRPHWHDLLPLKLSIWAYLSVKGLPQTVQVGCPALAPPLAPPSGSPVCVFQELKQYYEDYQQMKQQQKEEADAGLEAPASKHLTHWFP